MEMGHGPISFIGFEASSTSQISVPFVTRLAVLFARRRVERHVTAFADFDKAIARRR